MIDFSRRINPMAWKIKKKNKVSIYRISLQQHTHALFNEVNDCGPLSVTKT